MVDLMSLDPRFVISIGSFLAHRSAEKIPAISRAEMHGTVRALFRAQHLVSGAIQSLRRPSWGNDSRRAEHARDCVYPFNGLLA
jgi:hypothetical protein